MEYKIDYLGNHTNQIEDISETLFEEWTHLMPGIVQKDMEKSISERINFDKIPVALLALDENKKWIGTVSIKQYDLDSRRDISPWFCGFFVKKEYRNAGVGLALMKAIIDKARELKINRIYLYTEKAEKYYLEKDWKLIERRNEVGNQVSILEYNIGHCCPVKI